MSLAIGVHLGRYVMFASDCRITQLREDLTASNYFDGYAKLRRSHMGLLVGTGMHHLLDGVVDRILRERPTIDELLQMIVTQRAKFKRNRSGLPRNHIAHGLETTGWMLTFTDSADTSAGVRFILYHPMIGGGADFGVCEPEDPPIPILFMPDTPAGHALYDNQKRYGAMLRVCGADDDLTQSIAYNTGALRRIVAECAGQEESIGAECQVGVHLPDGHVFITEIMPPPDGVLPH